MQRPDSFSDRASAFVRSDLFRKILIAVGVLVVLLLVFQAGVASGYRRALFSCESGNRFFGEFFGPGDMRPDRPFPPRGEFPGGHGAGGTVVSIASSTITVADRDGIEKTVRTDDRTIVRKGREDAMLADITTGSEIAVFGEPEEGGFIRAVLIRILPEPGGRGTDGTRGMRLQ